MFCPRCGDEMFDDSAYCLKCGKRIRKKNTQRILVRSGFYRFVWIVGLVLTSLAGVALIALLAWYLALR